MAKRVKHLSTSGLVVDRVLLVGALCAATGYIVHHTWVSAFFYATAFMLGIIWSFRAITTNPAREFRLLATLMLVLLVALLAFNFAKVANLY